MGFSSLEEEDTYAEEVLPIARDEDPLLGGREPDLFLVQEPEPVDLMDGDNIHAESSGNLGDRGSDILVEEKLHRGLSAVEGF